MDIPPSHNFTSSRAHSLTADDGKMRSLDEACVHLRASDTVSIVQYHGAACYAVPLLLMLPLRLQHISSVLNKQQSATWSSDRYAGGSGSVTMPSTADADHGHRDYGRQSVRGRGRVPKSSGCRDAENFVPSRCDVDLELPRPLLFCCHNTTF